MRMSKEELLNRFPSWNEARNDIVATLYGDEPSSIYDENRYQQFHLLTGIFANLETVDAYIYAINGVYAQYNTLIGDIKIAEDDRVLCGSISVKYRGRCVNIYVLNMYGLRGLTILRIGEKVVGFCNTDGIGSPSIYTEEMEQEVIEYILNTKLDDYGVSVQKFMQTAREIYAEDKTNHILNKRFGTI